MSQVAVNAQPFATLQEFLRDIKFAHSIFALPFALLAAFVAANGFPVWTQVLFILVCMVSARTFAMGTNRLLDARLDALNPRTAKRAIPSGRLTSGFVLAVVLACVAVFVVACLGFGWVHGNWWPALLSPAVLLFIGGYPLLKRFTQLCHYYLGAALALAPICADVAISGQVHVWTLLLAGAVLSWTAGFDVIYACQDAENDRTTGVHAIPAKLGVAGALWVSRLTHVLSAVLLVSVGWAADSLGVIYSIAAGCACLLLLIEHLLVRANDLSKVNVAFFTVNGVISIVVGAAGMVDVLLG